MTAAARCSIGVVAARRQARACWAALAAARGLPRQAPPVPGARAARRLLRPGLPRRDRLLSRGVRGDGMSRACSTSSSASAPACCCSRRCSWSGAAPWSPPSATARRPGRRAGRAGRGRRRLRGRSPSSSPSPVSCCCSRESCCRAVLARSRVHGAAQVREETPLMNTTAVAASRCAAHHARLPGQPAAAPLARTDHRGRARRDLAGAVSASCMLVTRRHAISQLVGFLDARQRDRSGGVPHLRRRAVGRRAGASLDVLLVVLILRVLGGRMR